MSDKSSSIDERTLYGGQAVVEGVMMRSPRYFAIACRRLSNNEIVTKLEPVEKSIRNLAWLNKPFLRGTLALIDAMIMGIKALTYSANVQLEDETQAADEETKAAGALNAAIGEGVVQKSAGGPSTVVSQSINGIAIGATTVIALLFGFALFWTLPGFLTDLIIHHKHTVHHAFRAQVGSSFVEGLIRLGIFFLYLTAISRMGHVQRVFEYHGAEHKAINCLEAGLPVNLENARAASRIHPRCGTNFIFIVLITAILVFSVIPRHTLADGFIPMIQTVLLRLVLMPVVAGIAFEILKFAGSHRDKQWAQTMIAPGLWTQYLTTRVPDDSQLEVSIAALHAVWDKEHESVDTHEEPGEPAAEMA